MNLSSISKFSMMTPSISRPLYLDSNRLSWTSFSMLVRSMERLDIAPDLVYRRSRG